ncbi:MAG: alpha-glucan family phosphorylase, partial [Anaerolineales bacterium]|nr:alpha-glucan family phosphorylase [Anaerolineales bacterium]
METYRTEIRNHFSLPRRIKRLGELAYNLWWTWYPDAERLFRFIDQETWEQVYHNPVKFLRQVERARLNAVTYDLYYLDLYDHIFKEFDEYMKGENTWSSIDETASKFVKLPIAYLSTEFGLHETLPIYAGGLGVLSGDHIKEASDLGLPLVAIGFLYTRGYFTQHITEDGWQEARNFHLDFNDLPVLPVFGQDSEQLNISVDLPGREVLAQLWKIQVGRNPLFLLDTDVEENAPADRELTSKLYISDLELRISQEIILGIGGVRALRMLGYNPQVWHMNEGHSAFQTLERAREMVASGIVFEEALDKIKKTTIFTTHTPVPAGSDEFPLWLIDKYFSNYWTELGLDRDAFIDLARRK